MYSDVKPENSLEFHSRAKSVISILFIMIGHFVSGFLNGPHLTNILVSDFSDVNSFKIFKYNDPFAQYVIFCPLYL